MIRDSACSECGFILQNDAAAWRRRRAPLIGLLLLIFATTTGLWMAGSGVQRRILTVVLGEYRVEATHTIFDCRVEILRHRWNDGPIPLFERVRIHRRGRIVFDSEVMYPELGSAWVGVHASEGDVLTSVPNLSCPALWLRSHSGGSGGYSETWIFELGSTGGFLPRLHLEDGFFEESRDGVGPGFTHPVHPDDGGAVPPAPSRWIQPVLGFRYWLTSGAGSPAPILEGVLDWSHGFVPCAVDTTVEPAPAEFGIERALAVIARAASDLDSVRVSSDAVFSPLLVVYLDLVYAGRSRDAARFLRDAHRTGLGRVLESGAVSDLPRSLEAFESMLHERILRQDFREIVLDRNGGLLVRVHDLDE